jgi:hypothetical protein
LADLAPRGHANAHAERDPHARATF